MYKKKILLCILIIIFIVFFIKFKFFPFFIAIFIIYIISDGFYLKNLDFKIINLKEIFLLKNLEKIIILIFYLFIGIYFLYYTSVVLSYYKEVSIFRNKIKNSKDTETFGFEPSNAGKGGSEKANINGKVFKNVFEWMNFQKKSNRK